jgi:hypothetical protein
VGGGSAGGPGSDALAFVAKPDLTAMVLDIVTAQLDELDRRREAARRPAPRKPDAPVIYGQARPRIYGQRSG